MSVTLVDCDHIGWKPWKLHVVARILAQQCQHLCSSLPKGHPLTPRGARGNFGRLEVGWGKSGMLEQYLRNA